MKKKHSTCDNNTKEYLLFLITNKCSRLKHSIGHFSLKATKTILRGECILSNYRIK